MFLVVSHKLRKNDKKELFFFAISPNFSFWPSASLLRQTGTKKAAAPAKGLRRRMVLALYRQDRRGDHLRWMKR